MGVYGSATNAFCVCMAYPFLWGRHILDKIMAFFIWRCRFYRCRKNCLIAWRKKFCLAAFISSFHFRSVLKAVLFVSTQLPGSSLLDNDGLWYYPFYSNGKK